MGEARAENTALRVILRDAFNRQPHIRRNQVRQHPINLQRLFRLGIAGVANVAFIAQGQHQGAEHRFVEELRRVNAMQDRQALGHGTTLFSSELRLIDGLALSSQKVMA